MSPWALFKVLVASAVICKQRLLNKYEFVKYLQNSKYKEVNIGRLRKFLQTSKNVMKNNYHYTAHTFFSSRSISSYFLPLYCIVFYVFSFDFGKA